MEQLEQTCLKRQISLGPAVAAVAGEAIAVGIFLTPAAMARALASPFWLLIVWALMGFMAVTGAICYGQLASRFPVAGGSYVYLREGFGKPFAFLYGWMSLFVMDPGVAAALAIGLAAYLGSIVPLSALAMKAVAVAVILFIAALNIRGASVGAHFLAAVTWLKFGLLTWLVLWALALRLGSWANFFPFLHRPPGSLPLSSALSASCLAAFFSFGGWWDASKLAGEITDPERNLPRALLVGVSLVTAAYLLVSGMFLYLVPVKLITSDQTFVAQAGARLFGPAGGRILAGLVVACVLGSLAAQMMASPRVYYAMGRDHGFFRGIASLHPRFETPAGAIAIQAILASVLVLLGSFSQIIAYFIFAAVVFIALTVASLVRLPAVPASSPRLLWAAWTFLALALMLLLLIAFKSPLQSLLGMFVVLFGAICYAIFFKGR
jgi:APA family basic amino acid/polyamine antiporter